MLTSALVCYIVTAKPGQLSAVSDSRCKMGNPALIVFKVVRVMIIKRAIFIGGPPYCLTVSAPVGPTALFERRRVRPRVWIGPGTSQYSCICTKFIKINHAKHESMVLLQTEALANNKNSCILSTQELENTILTSVFKEVSRD